MPTDFRRDPRRIAELRAVVDQLTDIDPEEDPVELQARAANSFASRQSASLSQTIQNSRAYISAQKLYAAALPCGQSQSAHHLMSRGAGLS